VTPIESQLFFARAVLLILLYAFLATVGLVVWRELRAAGRAGSAQETDRPGARLIVLDGGASDRPPGSAFKLGTVTAVGRDLDNDLVFVDATVSGRHAVLHLRDGAWWVEDLGSTNGTVVNGQKVQPGSPAIARSGDIIALGGVRLRLVTPGL
jgi:pSer/pThr/pTyr-binding forkhead associated (FHA) protein